MALRADTIREFGELFVRDEPPRAQTHRAVVTAVDGGTVYVDVSGNGDATPIETTSAGYAIGDEVQVEQRGGRLHVSGNVTQPSVGARHVEQAVAPIAKTASQAQSASEAAQKVANEAAEVADATAQHFFDDTDGVHVTEADQEEWTSSHTGKNILINSLGILLRNALNNLVSITASAIAFFDGSGNAASNVVAQFGASGAQIGKSGAAHISMDADSVNMVNQYGTKLFSVDLPEVNQTASYYLATGASYASSGTFTYIMQPWVGKSGTVTVDIDFYNGSGSTRRYELPIAGIGESKSASHTFGSATYNCTVTWTDARTFTVTVSSQNPASGGGARLTQLRVYFPEDFPEFVFGTRDSTSPAPYASSLGMGANVQGLCQSVLGMYNEADMEKALIIGNGASDNARSNAFMVDWDGYIYRNNETAHIGTVVSANKTNVNLPATGNVDSPVAGASITVGPGVWLIVAHGVYNTASTTGARNLHSAIWVNGTSQHYQRIFAAGYNYARLDATMVSTTTAASTTIQHYMAASRGSNSANNSSYITAVKLV